MPRYECVEDGASKFWEITLEGSSFTVRYGKIGSDGQTNTKSFASPAQAQKEYDKLVASKVKKGYELVEGEEEEEDDEEGGPIEIPAFQVSPDLEREILANPGEDAPWLVYADWLQGHDDPRGALIAAHAKGKSGAKQVKSLLSEHEAAFLGRFAPGKDLAKFATIEWRLGFWSKAKIFCEYDTASEVPEDLEGLAGVLDQLLQHPSARLMPALTLGITEGVEDGETSWQESIDTIARSPRPALRELFIGDFEQEETEISWTQVGSLASLWPALPALQKLTVKGGGIELGAIVAPKLVELRLWSGGLPKEPVQQIARASLPALQHLEIWFGADDYGAECELADVAELLASTSMPALTSLGLMNSELADGLPALIAASPLLKQLKVLDLSMGTMAADGAQALLDNAAAFQHLEKLILDENWLPKATVTKLKRALPNAQIKEQRSGDYGPYVSVGE